MSTRAILSDDKIAPAAASAIGAFHSETIREIQEAIQRHRVVVVGMAQNPHVKNVRAALDRDGIEFLYLEYGSYLSQWRRRLAIKLWSGWPTFPQVFVRGTLLGGEALVRDAIADGTLRSRLDAPAGADGVVAHA